MRRLLMSLPTARIHCPDQIFSPFSGLPTDGEDGPNEKDSTLLFVYYGNAGDYAYISKRLQNLLDGNIESIAIETLHSVLSVDGGLILEVDTDWNGVNFYGFAPAG
jgi:hypothetical protein